MRIEGWESLLAEYMQTSAGKPFEWGTHDCALWAATWVRLATGVDHVSGWIGGYDSQFGALREMHERGFGSAEGIADQHLTTKPVRMTRRGDLVLHPTGALGICNGIRSHFVADGGMITEETLACAKAWDVA